ncbi:unnamed protein product [Adineta steineri]|uniref:Uncharacterized protein n=1 Tax=Adineta steineri TaxID=433720 RepID=A0A818WSI7_9BILA|nr:unnamed protein product [Adineta steineri]CAF3730513.1 unnamed protein product [Adineta steineri]
MVGLLDYSNVTVFVKYLSNENNNEIGKEFFNITTISSIESNKTVIIVRETITPPTGGLPRRAYTELGFVEAYEDSPIEIVLAC